MPQVARGLDNPKNYGDTSSLTPGQLADYFLQRHLAERAGPHLDLRIGTPEAGLLSWAVPGGQETLPEPGVKRLAVRQPIHRHDYGHWSGTIPEGYGKGTVKSLDRGQVLVTKITPNQISFTVAHKRSSERFVLFKPLRGRKHDWLLVNTTPTDPHGVEKAHFKSVPPSEIDSVLASLSANGGSLQPKIDGASTLINLLRNHAEAVSFRTSKLTGRPIVHTERLFRGRPEVDVPAWARDSRLRGELYAVDSRNRAIPAQQLNALLNSTIANSLALQDAKKTPLRVMLFDAERVGGRDLDREKVPYAERLELLKRLVGVLPQPERFAIPTQAATPDGARAMYDSIMSGKFPLTSEGVVYHPPTGMPVKVKRLAEHDAYITGTYPGKGRHSGRIGGFTYALQPGGKTVGRVGTGISDELRDAVAADPASYVGRLARLTAQEQLPSGALRGPSFLAFHEG